MLSTREKKRLIESFRPIVCPVVKQFMKEMTELVSNWVKEFISEMYREDLRCVLYAHMINKFEGGK